MCQLGKRMLRSFCNRLLINLAVLPALLFGSVAYAEMKITHTGVTHYLTDPNRRYELPLIVLALEKTRKEYGDFTLLPLDGQRTKARLIEQMRRNDHENLIRSLGYDQKLEDQGLAYVRFPIYLGLLSYRTCFTHESLKEKIPSFTTVQDLIGYTHGGGIAWTDNGVMRENGLRVVEIASVDSIIRMTARGRIDFFCRGASEVKTDVGKYSGLGGLHYDYEFALYYPMPVFLYTNKENTEMIERITKGLEKAHKDGSLQLLWLKNFAEGIEFQKLENRKIIKLKNPLNDNINFDFESFFYKP